MCACVCASSESYSAPIQLWLVKLATRVVTVQVGHYCELARYSRIGKWDGSCTINTQGEVRPLTTPASPPPASHARSSRAGDLSPQLQASRAVPPLCCVLPSRSHPASQGRGRQREVFQSPLRAKRVANELTCSSSSRGGFRARPVETAGTCALPCPSFLPTADCAEPVVRTLRTARSSEVGGAHSALA